jgi:hypothetical protein
VRESLLSPQSVAYLKRLAPSGCRDRATRDLLLKAGVEAFDSHCLTLTFSRRQQAPLDGRVFLVDLPPALRAKLPRQLAERAVVVSHQVQDVYGETIKFQIARRLLSLYREHAELVVTTRLHCALPCLGMGIPVVFLGRRDDPRFSVLEDLGLRFGRGTRIPRKSIGHRKCWRNALHYLTHYHRQVVIPISAFLSRLSQRHRRHGLRTDVNSSASVAGSD